MTDKARELLEAALDHLHGMNSYEDCLLKNRIRAYLAQPEVKRKRLSEDEIESLANSGLSPNWTDEFELYHFARAIEDALEKANA